MEIGRVDWLTKLSGDGLQMTLQEYRYFVHRFPLWLGLAAIRAPEHRVRELLLPNLLEEAGHRGPGEHLLLLDRCLASCGIQPNPLHAPLPSTSTAEAWFFGLCASGDVYGALCALGPGTESVSSQFLVPLEQAIRSVFRGRTIDYTYFDTHREEVEGGHARDLLDAIRLLEGSSGRSGERWVGAAVENHRLFWDGVKLAVASR